jgi:hypothetical protein
MMISLFYLNIEIVFKTLAAGYGEHLFNEIACDIISAGVKGVRNYGLIFYYLVIIGHHMSYIACMFGTHPGLGDIWTSRSK